MREYQFNFEVLRLYPQSRKYLIKAPMKKGFLDSLSSLLKAN